MIKVLELFGGIGACSKALANLGIEHEIVDLVEIDKYAVKSFNAVHGTNFEPQDITTWDKDIKVDLIMHGSPCQDFSVAGKQAGGDKDSGTRSSLMYETLRIVEKLKPKYVIWENVKNLLSKKHRHNFDAYLEAMEKLGYKNYYQVLNAKNYGVPQNRERVFTVSILDGGKYLFPEPVPLEKKLKDVLEKDVDEKYYLSEKAISCFMSDGTGKYPRRERFLQNINRKNQDIGNSITTRAGSRPTDNFVAEPNLKTKLCNELVKEGIVQGGEIINHSYTTSKQRNTLDKYIESNNGITPTLTTRPDCLGVVVDESVKPSVAKNFEREKENIATTSKEIYQCKCDSGWQDNKVGITVSPTIRSGNSSIYGLSKDLRIRKLTPKECWRLMGFDDSDFERAEKVNSNTQLYSRRLSK